jgi:hypothetical protein
MQPKNLFDKYGIDDDVVMTPMAGPAPSISDRAGRDGRNSYTNAIAAYTLTVVFDGGRQGSSDHRG